MAKRFFIDWDLWQKMVFILGCALLVTIVAGLIKLYYSHWRVRKYSALEKLSDTVQIIREKSIIRSLSKKNVKKPTKSPSIREKPPPVPPLDVAFGVRALEEGRLDEVWDSRPSSREVSQSDLSSIRTRNRSTTDLRHSRGKSIDRGEPSTTITDTESDGDVSSLQLPAADPYDGDRAGRLHQESLRGRYPPHSFAKYEGTGGYRMKNSFGPRLNTPLAQRHGKNGIAPVSSTVMLNVPDGAQNSPSAHSFASTYSQSPSEDTTHGSDHLAPDFRTDRSLSGPVGSTSASVRSISADSIHAMQTRRLSQVAETGQFRPRHRIEELEHGPEAEPPDHASVMADRMSFDMDPDGIDADMKHFSTPDIRVTADTPGLDGQAQQMPPPSSSIIQRGRRLRKRSNPSPTVTPPTTPVSSTFSVSSRRHSDILRRVNSGFAVLRPGSLEVKLATPMSAKSQKVRSSSAESQGSRAGSRGRKRLQKRVEEEGVGNRRRGSSQGMAGGSVEDWN